MFILLGSGCWVRVQVPCLVRSARFGVRVLFPSAETANSKRQNPAPHLNTNSAHGIWKDERSAACSYNVGMLALRYVYVLALVVWLGGMVVLGAIVAPATFQVLQASAPAAGRALAGEVFGAILQRFHYVAYAAGGALLVTLLLMRVLGPKPHAFNTRVLIVGAMLLIAVYSGVVVLGSIDAVRLAVGGLPAA